MYSPTSAQYLAEKLYSNVQDSYANLTTSKKSSETTSEKQLELEIKEFILSYNKQYLLLESTRHVLTKLREEADRFRKTEASERLKLSTEERVKSEQEMIIGIMESAVEEGLRTYKTLEMEEIVTLGGIEWDNSYQSASELSEGQRQWKAKVSELTKDFKEMTEDVLKLGLETQAFEMLLDDQNMENMKALSVKLKGYEKSLNGLKAQMTSVRNKNANSFTSKKKKLIYEVNKKQLENLGARNKELVKEVARKEEELKKTTIRIKKEKKTLDEAVNELKGLAIRTKEVKTLCDNLGKQVSEMEGLRLALENDIKRQREEQERNTESIRVLQKEKSSKEKSSSMKRKKKVRETEESTMNMVDSIGSMNREEVIIFADPKCNIVQGVSNYSNGSIDETTGENLYDEIEGTEETRQVKVDDERNELNMGSSMYSYEKRIVRQLPNIPIGTAEEEEELSKLPQAPGIPSVPGIPSEEVRGSESSVYEEPQVAKASKVSEGNYKSKFKFWKRFNKRENIDDPEHGTHYGNEEFQADGNKYGNEEVRGHANNYGDDPDHGNYYETYLEKKERSGEVRVEGKGSSNVPNEGVLTDQEADEKTSLLGHGEQKAPSSKFSCLRCMCPCLSRSKQHNL